MTIIMPHTYIKQVLAQETSIDSAKLAPYKTTPEDEEQQQYPILHDCHTISRAEWTAKR